MKSTIGDSLQVKAVSCPAISRATQGAAPSGVGAEVPDFFSLIDRQAAIVVSLARTTRAILQGKESVHSVRLLDLEQRRQELRRRNQAALNSPAALTADVGEINWTMEALDRVAAGLFRTARGVDQGGSGPDETSCLMIEAIETATESLRHGYSRLANGSPVAECDADAAMASEQVLGGERWLRFPEAAELEPAALSQPDSELFAEAAGHPAGRRVGRLDELHAKLAAIALEVVKAGAILKNWSRQLAAGWHDSRSFGGGQQARPVWPLIGG